jgi:hypothetical protein
MRLRPLASFSAGLLGALLASACGTSTSDPIDLTPVPGKGPTRTQIAIDPLGQEAVFTECGRSTCEFQIIVHATAAAVADDDGDGQDGRWGCSAATGMCVDPMPAHPARIDREGDLDASAPIADELGAVVLGTAAIHVDEDLVATFDLEDGGLAQELGAFGLRHRAGDPDAFAYPLVKVRRGQRVEIRFTGNEAGDLGALVDVEIAAK